MRTGPSAGGDVLGPFPDSGRALRSLQGQAPDCAVLDVNLGEGASFDLARTLRSKSIPFLFFTGYHASAIPTEFAHVPRIEKPVSIAHLLRAIDGCCHPRR